MQNRVSDELAGEIREYQSEKSKSRNVHDQHKAKFFKSILACINVQNSLSVESLLELLGDLLLHENDNLFYTGGFSSGPSSSSQAARLIRKLFADLGHDLSSRDLRDIVLGKICSSSNEKAELVQRIRQNAIKSISRQWQPNHYNEQKRYQLDHELKSMLFKRRNLEGRDDRSLAQTLYDSFSSPKNTRKSFIKRLSLAQETCPHYMPELLLEVYQCYQNSKNYESYLEAMVSIFEDSKKDASKNALCLNLLKSHHEFAKDIVDRFPGLFFELDSVMQAKVHQNLLRDDSQALEKIHDMALAELGVKVKEKERLEIRTHIKTTLSSEESEDEPEPEPEVDRELLAKPFDKQGLIDAIYSRVMTKATAILEERNTHAAIEKIQDYLYTRQHDKAKLGIFEHLLGMIENKNAGSTVVEEDTDIGLENRDKEKIAQKNNKPKFTLEVLQNCLTGLFGNEHTPEEEKFQLAELRKKVFATRFWLGEEDSSAAILFADLYHIASGRSLTKEERKDLVRGQFPGVKKLEALGGVKDRMDDFADRLAKETEAMIAERKKEDPDFDESKYREEVGAGLRGTHEIQSAHELINVYLGTTDYETDATRKSNPTKIGFFKALGRRISREGFSVSTIVNHLAQEFPWLSGRKKLFARKYIGNIEDSGAAKTLTDLYGKASGKEMTEDEITTLAWTGKFPQENELKSQIEKFLENPSKLISQGSKNPQAKLELQISAAYTRLQNAKAVLLRGKMAKRVEDQTGFQQKLIDQGIAQSEDGFYQAELRFDLQGHILTEVATKANSVYCSLDIKNNETLEAHFVNWMIEGIGDENKSKTLRLACQDLLNLSSRSSIIPLQEEMEMHMRYLSRIMENAFPLFDWSAIRKQAALAINKMTRSEFREILLNNQIDIPVLNCKLDEARSALTPHVHKILLEIVMKEGIDQEALENLVKDINKQVFPALTVSGQDYLRTDVSNQSVLGIAAVKDESMARIMHQSIYADGNVMPYDNPNLELNVPAMAIKEVSHEEAVEEVANKLHEHYNIFADHGHQGPMIFNLTNSLHSKLADILPLIGDHENRQRKITARILKGAHVFNLDQVLAGRANNLVYVQNMDVSQHGDKEIKYGKFDSAISESALMSEMAMLSSFASNAALLAPKLRARVLSAHLEVHDRYVDFLKSDLINRIQRQQGDIYFEGDERGNYAHGKIQGLKQYLRQNSKALNADDRAPLNELVIKTLLKMMALNKHLKRRYASLAQALSVFIEPASQIGAQGVSGRDEMVMKRVSLLQALDHLHQTGRYSEDRRCKKMVSAMLTFLNNNDRNKEDLVEILEAMNEVLNDYNVYGAAVNLGHVAHGVSEDSQASEVTKVLCMNFNAARLGKLGFFDGNPRIAEPQQLDNLRQNHAVREMGGLLQSFEEIKMQPAI